MLIEIVFGFIAVCVLFLAFSYFRLYQTLHKIIPETPYKKNDFLIKPDTVSFLSTDRVKLHGWLFKKSKAKGTMIIMHGHGDPQGGMADEYRWVKNLLKGTYNVLMFDFRGFGKSEFKLHTLGFTEKYDVLGAISFIKQDKNLKKLPIYLVGSSMGAVSAIRAASENKDIKGLVVVSPFKSLHSLFIKQVSLEKLPPYPFVWFLDIASLLLISFNVHLQSAKNSIKTIKVPILILYSDSDEMINQQDHIEIFKNAPEPKELHIVKNGKHNIYSSHPALMNKLILTFLDNLSK